MPPRRRGAHPHPGHSKAQCLKVLRRLSAYLDHELPISVCREIRKHIGACPNCEDFVTSLRQTVRLCRHANTSPMSAMAKARIRREIYKAVGLL